MPNLDEIYAHEAEAYQRLIAREDKDGLLLPAIMEVAPPGPLDVVDLGAGTGRLACLLAPSARSMTALDLSPSMLAVARKRLEAMRPAGWGVALADHRALPLADASADLVSSGMSSPSVWGRMGMWSCPSARGSGIGVSEFLSTKGVP